jgi:hypothetical protein
VQSALGVGGCGHEIFDLATCPLQFAKACSPASLSQQEKSNSADLKRSWGTNIGFIFTTHACKLLPEALASVPFGFILVGVRVPVPVAN